jgi:hypothetical protein
MNRFIYGKMLSPSQDCFALVSPESIAVRTPS